MSEACEAMLEAMREVVDRHPLLPGLVYRSAYDFVLEHGREYVGHWEGRYPIGVQKMCYGNAINLAGRHSLRYIEGFALAPTGEIILHAWNATETGDLVDSSWANTGLAYFGVEFSVERGDDATWNGDAHVLNDEYRGYPIFQKRWTGEDYSLEWPESDRLDALRNGHTKLPASMNEWLKEKV
jgi:hypothetical protein